MKCKNCGYSDNRQFTYCPECGKSNEKKNIKERISNWLAARKDARIEKLKMELEKQIDLTERAICEREDECSKKISLQMQLDAKTDELEDLLADRDANYIKLDKQIGSLMGAEHHVDFGRNQLTVRFHLRSNDNPNIKRLVLFNKEDLPAPDDEDEE